MNEQRKEKLKEQWKEKRKQTWRHGMEKIKQQIKLKKKMEQMNERRKEKGKEHWDKRKQWVDKRTDPWKQQKKKEEIDSQRLL